MLMTMQKKWEPHWLPGRTIGGLKSIFSLHHARLANDFPKFFEHLSFWFADENGRNLPARVAENFIGKPIPRNCGPCAVVDQVRLNDIKQEGDDLGKFERAPRFQHDVDFPIARHEDGRGFWVPELGVKTPGFDCAIGMLRERINVVKNVLPIVVRAEQNPVHEALPMFAAQRIVPFVEAKAAEELGERMPNRVVVNRAAIVGVDLIERMESLFLEVIWKLKNVEALEVLEHFVSFVRNSKGHVNLLVLMLCAQNYNLCTKEILTQRTHKRIMSIEELI